MHDWLPPGCCASARALELRVLAAQYDIPRFDYSVRGVSLIRAAERRLSAEAAPSRFPVLAATRRETTTGLVEITMGREIVMGRNQLTAATMRHGMDAPQTGRYRAANVSPTKARSVEGRTRRTAARPDTRYRAANVSRTLDRVSQKGVFAPVLVKQQLRQLGDVRRDPPRQTVLRLFGPKQPTSNISYSRGMDWGQVSIFFGVACFAAIVLSWFQ
jgi:hypothetical protein